MSKKIYELKHTRAGLITEAEQAVAKGDQGTYESKMTEVKKLNDEIKSLELIEVEKGRFKDNEQSKVSLSESLRIKKDEDKKERTVNAIRSTNEYRRAFASAIRNGVTPSTAFAEEYNPLKAALTEGGGTPAGSDGGFLVPIDIDNEIKELRRQRVALLDLVQVENVTAPTGWRVKDVAPTKGFTKLTDELTAIPEDDQPQFSKVDYSLDDYGLFVPISKQLLADEDANLLGYLARWFAVKSIITENAIILAELAKLDGVSVAAGKELEEIKKALNVTLDPDISLNAKFLANQNVFNLFDSLESDTNKPVLQPDVAEATGFNLVGYPIVRVGNSTLAANSMYVGDFAQYLTFFRRQALEVDSTDVGGDAWRKYGYEVRGIMRCAGKVFDSEAVAKLDFDLTGGA